MNSSTSSSRVSFLVFCLFFWFGGGAFIFASEWLIRSQVMPYSVIETDLESFRSALPDFVAFGDSHVANALLETERFTNLAVRGDNLETITHKLNAFLARHQPRGVILGADAQQFAPYRLSADQSAVAAEFTASGPILLHSLRPSYRQYLRAYWTSAFNGTLVPVSSDAFTATPTRLIDSSPDAISRASADRVLLHTPMAGFAQHAHAMLLERAVTQMTARNIAVCLVKFPLSQPYLERATAFTFGTSDQFYRNLAMRTGAVYLDHSSSWPDELFGDPDHLNAAGSAQFTPQLLTECFGEVM